VIRLLIAARSAVVRAGLEALAASSPGIEVLGAYAELGDAEGLCPDVVLASAPLDELTPAPAIVLLCDDPQTAWTQEAIRMGLRSALPQGASPAEIVGAIEAAGAGLAAIDPQDLEAMLAHNHRVPEEPDAEPLTARELDVLRMLAEGAANKVIAHRLDISEHTVKFHVGSIMAKLNAGSRTEAVTMGIRRGLVMI
jgi:NarL family two-component system response regulator YdfI